MKQGTGISASIAATWVLLQPSLAACRLALPPHSGPERLAPFSPRCVRVSWVFQSLSLVSALGSGVVPISARFEAARPGPFCFGPPLP